MGDSALYFPVSIFVYPPVFQSVTYQSSTSGSRNKYCVCCVYTIYISKNTSPASSRPLRARPVELRRLINTLQYDSCLLPPWTSHECSDGHLIASSYGPPPPPGSYAPARRCHHRPDLTNHLHRRLPWNPNGTFHPSTPRLYRYIMCLQASF